MSQAFPEKKAGSKWCPFARVVMLTTPAKPNGNRQPDGHALNGSHCLGHRCAMWAPDEIEGYGRCGMAAASGAAAT